MEINNLTLRLILILCIINTSISYSMDIGSLTSIIQEDQNFIAKVIRNNTERPHIYDLEIHGLLNPKLDIHSKINKGEVLFTPKKFVLAPGESKIIKIFYNGLQDDKERYYKILFRELPAPNQLDIDESNDKAAFYMTLSLEGILVVRPRQLNFSYLYDRSSSTILNNGNTYFEIIQKKTCDQPDSEATSRYLLSNERMKLEKPKSNGDIVIVHKNKFIYLTNNCNSY
ncbi:fimbria/pilus periplasmic chaperone [Shewanella algae]|uniref:fimbria/pilus periplasmic chaperone n=1 Tax=Shewanella algae TaxID=38313 RepID=UPI0034D4D0FC